MPKGSEANDLFRIDAESLLDYSNNIMKGHQRHLRPMDL